MPGGPSYYLGDIVLVEYPFSDHIITKYRPAIVVSNYLVNRGNSVVLSPITSTIRNNDQSLVLTDTDLTRALDGESEIRCDFVVTILKDKIKRKISSLKTSKHLELYLKIINCFKPI